VRKMGKVLGFIGGAFLLRGSSSNNGGGIGTKTIAPAKEYQQQSRFLLHDTRRENSASNFPHSHSTFEDLFDEIIRFIDAEFRAPLRLF
jgi:hypothetical protein